MTSFEIILPLRNPPAAFGRTVDSLAAQSNRDFSILISDNYSTAGLQMLDQAQSRLEAAGISVRRVRPPIELGRVEHWNWAHYESTAEWLKPLFAGDWLEPSYVARVRETMASHPQCRYIFARFQFHLGDKPPVNSSSPWKGWNDAGSMKRGVLTHGMQFGPPSAAAFQRAALIAIGGYPTAMPICSDSLMFCAMAARFGVFGIHEPLCHFNIHDARFSTSLPQKRRDTLRETITYLCMLGYHAWSAESSIPWRGFLRMIAREVRAYNRGAPT